MTSTFQAAIFPEYRLPYDRKASQAFLRALAGYCIAAWNSDPHHGDEA